MKHYICIIDETPNILIVSSLQQKLKLRKFFKFLKLLAKISQSLCIKLLYLTLKSNSFKSFNTEIEFVKHSKP